MSLSTPSRRVFTNFAWFVLGYTVLVIMWGAFVRATGSGAGCGEHWPLCNGEVIPRDPGAARIIEFGHRVTSGVSLLLVGGLFFWSRRIFRVGHAVRRASAWSLVFILGEAAVGAMLVILQLVAGNDSAMRAIVIALHLVNTFLLLFWLSRVTYSSAHEVEVTGSSSQYRRARLNIMMCMVLFVLTGAAGAIVALGDTLFPAKSLVAGVAEDFSATAHFLIKLRIWHPIIAIFATIYILMQMIALPKIFNSIVDRKLGVMVAGLVSIQLLGGFLNWILLAPVWMQLVHLLLADITWIVLCFWYFNIGREANQLQGENLK